MTKGDSSSKTPAPKLQTITLKAFVHCEGCRRKIRRIIRILDGVEDVVVDSPTGKVTVTGTDIDVKTILQRLQKYGKHAEVWPSSVSALPPASKPAGENQPKPATNNNNNNHPDNNSKKKNNAGGESGSGKAEGGTGNEGQKGGGKKEDQGAPVEEKGKEGPASQKKPEKSKETHGNIEAGNANTSQQSGGGSGGGGGGGGGKKGKKGGNGNNNGNSGGGGGGNNGGEGGGGIPELLPPPSLVQDRPIASVPTTTSITVSANKAHYDSVQTGYADYNSVDYATHMFSDENANNCSIM